MLVLAPRPIVPRDLVDRLSSSESESGFGGPRRSETGEQLCAVSSA